MEDTTILSTSASSVRTLHRSLTELAAQRDQLSSNKATECVHCSGNIASTNSSSIARTHSVGINDNLTSSASDFHSSYTHQHQSSIMNSSTLVLPSPPDSPNLSPIHSTMHSPSLDSVSESSLPSVSSSFFFSSSAAGSPGRSRGGSYPGSYPHSEHGSQQHLEQDPGHAHWHAHSSKSIAGHNLIIPSLTLPTALRRPTPFGQTLGEMRLLVLGAQGAGKSFLTGLLLEDNEDVVEVGTWEDWEEGSSAGVGLGSGITPSDVDGAHSYGYGKVLRASTDWVEQKDVFGLERYEPTRNVHIVELPGYSHNTDSTELITQLKRIIETPFRALSDVLHPEMAPSGVVASLLASPTSPLYTAMVFLLPSPPTALDRQIISALSTHIPLIVLPRLHGPHRDPSGGSAQSTPYKLSNFRPASAVGLRNGLFHSPETVALLRGEAADRFLRWREVERSVDRILGAVPRWQDRDIQTLGKRRLGEREWGRFPLGLNQMFGSNLKEDGSAVENATKGWSKAKWEAEWMETHSHDVDVVRRMREGTITEKNFRVRAGRDLSNACDNQQTKHEIDSQDHGDENGLRPVQARDKYSYPHATFDPLHLPSLIVFSLSLLGPLKARLTNSVHGIIEALADGRVKIVLFGGFCVGLGVGLLVR